MKSVFTDCKIDWTHLQVKCFKVYSYDPLTEINDDHRS